MTVLKSTLWRLSFVAFVAGMFASKTFGQTPGADASSSPEKTQPKFELKDGDRVVFLGNTLIERAQKYGYWESVLTARYPNRKVIFRNLGWDGDTVWAESRGIFDSPAKGYARMLAHVGRIKPTVIFLGYGNNEAFAGKAGLPRFVKQYNSLMNDLTKVAPKGVRFVLLSPTLHEEENRDSREVPTEKELLNLLRGGQRGRGTSVSRRRSRVQRYNDRAVIYSEALRVIARKRRAHLIDLAAQMKKTAEFRSLFFTSNGMHFSRSGYRYSANLFAGSFHTFRLKGPALKQYEKLRHAIIEKNRLYFHSWRPQNITYLFLFRKHEQGNNAKETQEFLKLVTLKEKEIDRLKKSVPRPPALIRVKDGIKPEK